jgi:prepilin-type N-terminal cleavage/methylation domain-containing protein
MKNVYKQKREQGFTIIEVMIVLAIAAVILLIVLLAVPALQRNSRNTQRNNDAATLAAGINTCMANHNSVVASCSGAANGVAGSGKNVDIDFSKMGQLTAATGTGGACTSTTTSACWFFASTCSSDGTSKVGATSREFAVLYNVETSAGGAGITRCVAS